MSGSASTAGSVFVLLLEFMSGILCSASDAASCSAAARVVMFSNCSLIFFILSFCNTTNSGALPSISDSNPCFSISKLSATRCCCTVKSTGIDGAKPSSLLKVSSIASASFCVRASVLSATLCFKLVTNIFLY